MIINETKNTIIKLVIKRIKEGKKRDDFLLEMYRYWRSAEKMLDEKEKQWLLKGLPESE